MKYILALLLTLHIVGCSSQNNIQKQNDGGLKELLQAGKDVYIENQVFQDDIDITTLLSTNPISEGIFQAKTVSSITFKNCRFEGKMTAFANRKDGVIVNSAFLSSVSFLQCIFNNEVNFRGGSIYGMADFTKSVFNKKTNFEECTFYQNAYFNGCNFSDETRFQNSFFMKRASFMNAEFKKISSFQNTTFNSEVQFSVAKFQEYADFSLIKCHENSYFNYCEFNGNSNFNDSHFTGSTDFLKVKFKNSEFKKASFLGEPRFFDSNVSETINLDNTFFLLGQPDLSFLAAGKVKNSTIIKRTSGN